MSEPDAPAVVVTAIPEELAPILRYFGRFSVGRAGGRKVFRTVACRPPLLLASTGDGRTNAARGARALCEAFRPKVLVGVGAAGALTHLLPPLELVASAHLRNGSVDPPAADSILLSRARSAGARLGTLVTVETPVVSSSGKKALSEALLGSEPAAVDMESAAWARAASDSGVPFVVVRAIADGLDDELPDYLPNCVGADGGIRRASVLWRALARPSTFATLLQMRRRVWKCGERLAVFLNDFFGCELE